MGVTKAIEAPGNCQPGRGLEPRSPGSRAERKIFLHKQERDVAELGGTGIWRPGPRTHSTSHAGPGEGTFDETASCRICFYHFVRLRSVRSAKPGSRPADQSSGSRQ